MRIIVRRLSPSRRAVEMASVAVVLPAYNEEENIARVVDRALAAGVGRVVCVNDCSADGTAQVVDRLAAGPRVEALHHAVNQGKQAAVKHGLAAALAHRDRGIFAVLDADMQNDPALLPGLCGHVGQWDVVIGLRGRGDMPPVRIAANALANLPYQVLAGIRIHDIQSGYRVYTRPVAECLAGGLTVAGRYTLEHTSMLLFGELAAREGRQFRIAEVPIPYSYEGARSSIRALDNLQLTWASIYHAAALARLR